MAPNPTCTALANAMTKKKMDYKQVATALGEPEQHVIDVCTGAKKPTDAEFDALARVLDIKERPPHQGVHSTE